MSPSRRRGPAADRASSKQRSDQAAPTEANRTEPSADRARVTLTNVLDVLEGVAGTGAHWQAKCPVHDDREPSLCIDVRQFHAGLGSPTVFIRCPVCGANGDKVLAALGLSAHRQSIYHFGLEKFLAPPKPTRPLPSDDDLARCSDHLFGSPELLSYVTDVRGVSEEVARKVRLGFHEGLGSYVLPVFDEAGAVVNVRRYRPNGIPKMRNWPGHGRARLYPAPPVDAPAVVVAEGEWDALVARSHGLTAVSGTHGAATWLTAWSAALAGKHVAFVYDCDKAGRYGAKVAAESVRPVAQSVTVVDLGLGRGEDLTDWFVKHGRTLDDLRKLLNAKGVAGAGRGRGRNG
jgi:hypothetical protein